MRKPRAKKPKAARARRPPTVAFTLITQDEQPTMYARLARLVELHHDDLADARIALAWCTSWRIDTDGHQKLGRCKRASDLDRELQPEYDFVVLLNREFWESDHTTDIVRDALLDHELCHATTRDDPDTGDAMRDERGRICYRIRKHDVEDFHVNVERFGIWRRDLDRFARAIAAARKSPLPFDPSDAGDPGDAAPGPRAVNLH